MFFSNVLGCKQYQDDPDIQKLISQLDDRAEKKFSNNPLVFKKEIFNPFMSRRGLKRPSIKSILKDNECTYPTSYQQLSSRVEFICLASRFYITVSAINNRFQCTSNASRSCNDIYRIYKHYFDAENPRVELVDIMRELYYLAVSDKTLGSQYCRNVKKYVFWNNDDTIRRVYDTQRSCETGIPFILWGRLFRKGVDYNVNVL